MATKKATVKKKTTITRSTKSSSKDMVLNAPLGSYAGELIGTFLLASIVIATQAQPIFVLFALIAIVLAVGSLSGAHLNPAITFGAWVTKKMPALKAVGYIVSQVIGALLAYVVLNALLGGEAAQQNPMTGQAQKPELFGATQLTAGKEWYAFWASILGSTIFGFAVASAFRDNKERMASAFAVGGGLFLGLIIAGASAILNPAVAVSLQAFADLKGDNAMSFAVLVHIIAPLIGAAIGFVLYDFLRKDVDNK